MNMFVENQTPNKQNSVSRQGSGQNCIWGTYEVIIFKQQDQEQVDSIPKRCEYH